MLGSLGRDKDFLGCNWFYVATWFFVLRHGSQAAGHCKVATGVFLVTTELFFSCFLSRQGLRQCFVFCCDRGSLVAIETVTTRGQGCNEAWLRPRDFVSR